MACLVSVPTEASTWPRCSCIAFGAAGKAVVDLMVPPTADGLTQTPCAEKMPPGLTA
eukprot:CAMPEP_0206539982 /NCGR_PEP_ID=MMETSP0325_2-20121206/8729_1 /ASSEMBLY_ACC=CAM_ASM_000347 /TAXON_ID=2866 /ORGANISM="Crypthecodinium cohnii, Strain Seligo" /LENGTH=56 /DNA_ID=CAMNT_0054037609 /DNA_START=449 /DNA_END=616 /DNA_ORIENTATION=-